MRLSEIAIIVIVGYVKDEWTFSNLGFIQESGQKALGWAF